MIHVVYPQGCYGSYLMQCIYIYSDLGNKTTKPKLKINNKTGSSHQIRESDIVKKYFEFYHLTDVIPYKTRYKNSIVVLPSSNNLLDYMDNQYLKRENGNIIDWIKTQESENIIKNKLSKFWNYSGYLNNCPNWIFREYISFFIKDSWSFGYDRNFYEKFPSDIKIETNQLFDVSNSAVIDIIHNLGLSLVCDFDEIKESTKYWIGTQKFHNIQNKCDSWINSIISNSYQKNPCLTIIDEAYVQMELRKMGYEIRCDGLIEFPESSLDMHKLVY